MILHQMKVLALKITFPKPSILWKIFAVPATRDQDDESVTLRRSEGHFQADFRRMSYWSHWSCVMHEQLEEIELIHIIQSFMEDNEPLMSYRYRMELILNRTHAWGINLSVVSGSVFWLSVLLMVTEWDQNQTIQSGHEAWRLYVHCSWR